MGIGEKPFSPKVSGFTLKKPKSSKRPAPLPYILIFLGLAAGIIAIGWISYRQFARNVEREVSDQLASIIELKTSEISLWRKERVWDAVLLARNSALADLVQLTLQTPSDGQARAKLSVWFESYLEGGQYDRFRLLDPEGNAVLTVPAGLGPVSPDVLVSLQDVIRSRQPEFVDLHRSEPEQRVFMNVLIPIAEARDNNKVAGVLSLRIDPNRFLFPLLAKWPVPSASAETLLVRREGDAVLYLNNLRFRPDAALVFSLPLSTPTLAGIAVQGREGFVKANDYRGKPAIGYIGRIPDSPWYLVARMDRDEVEVPLRKRLRLNLGLIVVLLFIAGLGGRALQLRQIGRYYRESSEAARSFHLLSSRQEALLAALPEIIMEVDQKKVYVWANRPGIEFFGEDVIGKEASEYFVGNQNTYQVVEPVFTGSEDLIYVESWQRRKDGQVRLLAWWCLSLKDSEGVVTGAISSARDITEQRKAEDARRESEARYRTLIDNAPLAVLVNRENKIVLVNEACLRLFKATSPDQLLGKSPFDLFHPDYHGIMRERIRMLRDLGKAVPTIEEKIIRLDGVAVDVEVTAAPFTDQGVNAIHVVINDITERKSADNRMKAALEASRASEEKFRKAFTTSPDSVNINRMSDGMYVSINKGFTQAMGYTEGEILGRTSLEFNIWDDPEDRRRLVQGLRLDGVVENLEARFRRKNGDVGVGLMSAALIEIEGVPHILSITRDITERKRSETALRESEAKFRNIFENIQDVYYETALDGTILEISPSITLLARNQYTRETLLGKSILEFYADPQEREKFLADLKKEGKLADYEITLRNRDGSLILCSLSCRIFFDPAGQPEKIVGSMRDIGERKKAEIQKEDALAALRENEAIFDQLMKNSPVYMFFKDENLRPIRLSANFREMLGRPVEQALGKTMDELFPSDLSKKIIADDKRILEQGRPVVVEEELNGRFYTTIKFPIHVEGRPRQLAGFTIDTTERKRAEDRIKNALEALQVSLREKELLLQEVHHRVKNNLQIISSLFNLEAEHASDETRRVLKRGQARIRSLSLVHEKLYRAANLSRIDLPGYIESLVTHLFHVYLVDPTQVRLETDFEEVSLDINSAIPCGLILNELIANTLKHAFPEGRKGVVRIRLARGPGGAVELEVSDDGIGLPETIDVRNPEGFGFQIINLLINQLEAKLTLDRTHGTSFVLKFKELKYKPRI